MQVAQQVYEAHSILAEQSKDKRAKLYKYSIQVCSVACLLHSIGCVYPLFKELHADNKHAFSAVAQWTLVVL